MHLSSFSATVALSLGMAVAGTSLGFSQSADYVTNGGEYAISAAVAGDQIRARAVVNSQGGFLLFEDNFEGSKEAGQGIGAVALDSNFNPVSPRFRVNQNRFGDQERPQGALLNGGGVMFVWQSRPAKSDRHIFGRWLSASNTWLTGDTMINKFTGGPQYDPVLATLQNGNVIVAYGSMNQASSDSMQDIYARIFSPTGAVVVDEFAAHPAHKYNQRSPALAVLGDGRFVLTWVSEQQRWANSVDIFARIFNPDGSAATSEILVNTTATNVCANPSVAPSLDGGFVVAWGEKDQFDNNTSWDVFGRSFSASGVASNGAVRLNTFTFGDQYAPSLQALDKGFLAIWTSMGEDGSWDGVYGRFLNTAGEPSSGEFRVNSTTIGRQTNPSLASDGSARFVASWSSFTGLGSGLDIYAQRFAASDYIATAPTTSYFAPTSDPFPTDVFPVGGDTNSYGTNIGGLVLNLPPVDASTGAVLFVKGTFYGIFSDETNGVSPLSSGAFTATVTERGVFTAKFIEGGKTYSGSGRFNANGRASLRILRGSQHSLAVNLQLDPDGTQITGTLSDSHWTVNLVAFRNTFNRKSNPAELAGTYSVQVPSDARSTNGPVGVGVGSVKIDLAGKVTLMGSLADGSKVTQTTALFDSGYWAMYVSLYSGSGCALSWMQVSNNGTMDGQCVWLKPARLASKYYTGGFSTSGFTNIVEATGSLYTAPRRGQTVLDWVGQSGSLVLGGGAKASGTYTIQLGANNRITAMTGEKLSLTVTPSTGLFKGVFTPSGGEKVQIQGALFQDSQTGTGYFLGPKTSGSVYLGVQP